MEEHKGMGADDGVEAIKARAARRYWATLIAWYAGAAVLALLNGMFAASPWWVSVALFCGLELVTGYASMVEDDWGNDFRGDREIFVRGTVANAVVAFAFTGVAAALGGGG